MILGIVHVAMEYKLSIPDALIEDSLQVVPFSSTTTSTNQGTNFYLNLSEFTFSNCELSKFTFLYI